MTHGSEHTRWHVGQKLWGALVCARTREAKRMLSQTGKRIER
ncbi:hypothetical protein [Pararhizobium qamdonense]|nr:hypothetical protein [Pararhizobium qamdonense]